MLKNYLLVGAGGAVGAMLRYGIGQGASLLRMSGPLGTFLINAVGSFAIGLLLSSGRPGSWTLFATVGLCGGFTTFSTFSMQSVTLIQQGRYASALLYIAGTVLICLLCAWLGILIGRRID